MKKSIIATAVIILLASCGGGNAKLVGNVKESSKKAPIENAIVRVGDIEAKTDRNGDFILDGLASGKTTIFVIAEGYKSYEFGGYELRVGENRIEEIFIEKDLKVVKDPDSNKIILPPPLPGTPVKTKPAFKEFTEFKNCIMLYSIGDIKTGGGNMQVFKYSNNIMKIENAMPSKFTDPSIPLPHIYVGKGKMIMNAGKNEWVSSPLPPPDPNSNISSNPDSMTRFMYSMLFKLLGSKDVTINDMGMAKTEQGNLKKYYMVSEDEKGNLFDGEIFVQTEGAYKDFILKFSGRLLINGIGDTTEISILDIGKVPPLSLPENIREMPPVPEMKPGEPPKKQNP